MAGAGGLLSACSSGSTSSGQAAASPSSTAKRRGGALKVGLTGGSGTDTLDPHKGLTYLDTARAQSLYQPLLQLNGGAQTEFVLAEEISPHGSTSNWVIKLRPGITFHDGKPLTADDVIFTLRRIISGKLTGATPLGPIDLKNLKALDKHTVQVPMTSPYGSFVDQLSYWYYLYIVPDGFNPAKPNGTGAFKYQSFTPGQRSVFTRNENYWKTGLPYVDTLTIIDFSDSTSLQKALTPFTMRVDKAPFNDVNVRQAMRLLVDRQQLIDSALDGSGTIGADVSSPYDPNYDTSLHREQDIAQAKSLLKKAGQENLKVQLVTSAVATGTVAMATVLSQQAKAAGVTISLKTVDPGTFFGPNYLQWTFSQDFYNYSPYLSQVSESLLPASPFNETHWTLPHYGQLYKQANATADPAVRKEIEHEMQQIDFTQGGYIIPAFIDALDAYSTKITGYAPARVGQPLSDFNFEQFSFI